MLRRRPRLRPGLDPHPCQRSASSWPAPLYSGASRKVGASKRTSGRRGGGGSTLLTPSENRATSARRVLGHFWPCFQLALTDIKFPTLKRSTPAELLNELVSKTDMADVAFRRLKLTIGCDADTPNSRADQAPPAEGRHAQR